MELPRTIAAINDGIARHQHTGAQLFVSLAGQTIADIAVGESAPSLPMRTDMLLPWRSSTKPLAAVAIAQLWERGELVLDDPVARHIPEFAQHNKDRVTIRHLLTHTGGFRAVPGMSSELPWDQLIAIICAARLEPGWTPGQKAGYHPMTSWYILGEIIHRTDGRPLDRYARDEIFLPCQMSDCWLSLTPDQYTAYGRRIAHLHNTARAAANKPPKPHEPGVRLRPGSSGRGPMNQLARFYQMLLNHGRAGDRHILSPQSVEALTARHRVGLYDHTFKYPMEWGLGFTLNARREGETMPYGFGVFASPRAFGHGGQQSSSAFADPEHRLAVAWCANGTPGENAHSLRANAINTAIYQDLGLTG